jgi:hypothetical protein
MDKKANFGTELSEMFKANPTPFLAAGAGALAGGGLTAIKKREEGESRLKRLGRILSNAAIVGGTAGLGTQLLQNSAKGFSSVLPEEDVSFPEAAGNALTNQKAQAGLLTGGAAAALYSRGKKIDDKELRMLLESRDLPGSKQMNIDRYKQQVRRSAVPGNTLSDKVFNQLSDIERTKNFQTYADSALGKLDIQRAAAGGPAAPHISGNRFAPSSAWRADTTGKLNSAGLTPGAGKLKEFAIKHMGRIAGRSYGEGAKRFGTLGAAASLPFIVPPLWRHATKGQDPAIYE